MVFKIIVGKPYFNDQFKKIVKHYKMLYKHGYILLYLNGLPHVL